MPLHFSSKDFEILDLDPPNNPTSNYGACHFGYNLALNTILGHFEANAFWFSEKRSQQRTMSFLETARGRISRSLLSWIKSKRLVVPTGEINIILIQILLRLFLIKNAIFSYFKTGL